MTLKKYFHIGIAVDTPNGLMVPKIRNANNKKISLLSKELKEVSELCRNLKIDKKELFGGSMTITSLGGIGGVMKRECLIFYIIQGPTILLMSQKVVRLLLGLV